MQHLKVAILQTELYWEDTGKNLNALSLQLERVEAGSHWILLPEMFTTGFSMNPHIYAKDSYEKGLEWMAQQAAEKQMMISGSMMAEYNGAFVNRLINMLPDGTFHQYDKKHLFTMAGEQKYYKAGNKKLIFDYLDWKICSMICYDLRFPVWCRNTEDFDILTFHANWPERRINHWNDLLKARAIENQVYVLAVNRTGVDGNGVNHNGYSQVIDPAGEIMCQVENKQGFIYQVLEKDNLKDIRNKLPFLRDKD